LIVFGLIMSVLIGRADSFVPQAREARIRWQNITAGKRSCHAKAHREDYECHLQGQFRTRGPVKVATKFTLAALAYNLTRLFVRRQAL
jgi:hypothetical protein